MGEIVLSRLVADRGWQGRVLVTSAGTGDWHIGEQADARTLAALAARGYDGGHHRARLFEPGWFGRLDLVVALDRGHERTLRSWAPDEPARSSVHLLRGFDPAANGASGPALDVPDPYYRSTRAFEHALDLVEAGCRGMLSHLDDLLRARVAS